MISVLPITGTISIPNRTLRAAYYANQDSHTTSDFITAIIKPFVISCEKQVGLQSNSFAENVGFEPTGQFLAHSLANCYNNHSVNSPKFAVSKSTPLETKTAKVYCCGGSRIRTHGAGHPAQRFSRPPP